jgi:hypothetical protein
MVRRKRRLFVIAGLIAVLGLAATAIAVAAIDNRPSTQAVTGTFSASPENVKQRVCDGQDGVYLEIRGKFAGVITSSDPRLTGDLEFMAEPALVNLVTGLGTFQGRFTIRDPATGAQKAQGQFHTVVTEASLNHGFAVAKVMNQGAGSADDFFASFKSTLDASLNVTGQFGGAGDPRTPAVIQGGHCQGPFTTVP